MGQSSYISLSHIRITILASYKYRQSNLPITMGLGKKTKSDCNNILFKKSIQSININAKL